MAEPGTELEMEIKGMLVDPSSNVPIVILRHGDSDTFLPIWIGLFEANAIALQLEGVRAPRPMTHDLLLSSISTFGGTVERIVICDLIENTFHARIHLRSGTGAALELDARPSDAIALAIRCDAPIYVVSEVLDRAKADDLATDSRDDERLKKWLEELDPEEFGEYTM